MNGSYADAEMKKNGKTTQRLYVENHYWHKSFPTPHDNINADINNNDFDNTKSSFKDNGKWAMLLRDKELCNHYGKWKPRDILKKNGPKDEGT